MRTTQRHLLPHTVLLLSAMDEYDESSGVALSRERLAAKQGTAATHRVVGTPLVDQALVRDSSRLSFNVALYFLMRHGP